MVDVDRMSEIRSKAREEKYQNEVIRAGAHHGMSILEEMEKDLVQAWIAHDQQLKKARDDEMDSRVRIIRGRIRGIAQCIALVKSPYSRRELGPTSVEWMRVIKQQEAEGHARARLQGKRRDGEDEVRH